MAVFISLVALIVPGYDAGLAFYVDQLGFELLEDTQLSETKRWVRVAPPGRETSILLAQADDDDQIAAIGQQTGGRVSFFLQTDDFISDFERFKSNGVTFLEEPRHETYGTVAVFTDPFGNKWDLIQSNR